MDLFNGEDMISRWNSQSLFKAYIGTRHGIGSNFHGNIVIKKWDLRFGPKLVYSILELKVGVKLQKFWIKRNPRGILMMGIAHLQVPMFENGVDKNDLN